MIHTYNSIALGDHNNFALLLLNAIALHSTKFAVSATAPTHVDDSHNGEHSTP